MKTWLATTALGLTLLTVPDRSEAQICTNQPIPCGGADNSALCCAGAPLRWANADVPLRMHPVSFPNPSTGRTDVLQTAARWQQPGSSFRFTVTDGTNTPPSSTNLTNEVYFLSRGPDQIVGGVTKWRHENIVNPNCGSQPCCSFNPCRAPSIVEADVEMYVNFADGTPQPWTLGNPTPLNSPEGFPRFFRLAVQHEMGHAAGLGLATATLGGHTPDGMDRMSPNGGGFHPFAAVDSRVQPSAKDVKTLRFMYPGGTATQDIFAVNVQSNRVTRKGVTTTTQHLSYENGNDVNNPNEDDDMIFFPRRSPVFGSGALTNTARVGDTARVKLCFGNRGPSDGAAITVSLFLSSDAAFGSDTAAGSFQLPTGIAQESQRCQTVAFTVPSVPVSASGTQYFVLYQVGTGSNNRRANANQRLRLIP